MMKGSGSEMIIPVFQVDAFTDEPFRGNPAAVCLVDKFHDEVTMKRIAMEMNLSETAFVVPLKEPGEEGRAAFSIRWFTPSVEVPLCGHATLAASWVIFNERAFSFPRITFESASGKLAAALGEDGITLDFPLNGTEPAEIPDGLLDAMGIRSVEDARLSKSAEMLLLRVADEAAVRGLQPDFKAMLGIDRGGLCFQGVIVTSRSSDFDFLSRYFGPWEGIDEDPVTGSAHTVLAPYWSRITGRSRFRAFQASKRGGELTVAVTGDRVKITGRATTVLRGELLL